MGISPERESQLSHKLIVLAELMIETLDELEYGEGNELYDALNTVMENSEKLVGNAFKVESVYHSTYLMGLARKIDEVVENNFKEIH